MSNLVSVQQLEAKRPTLNEFLSEHGVSDDICTKLANQDIGWDELLWLESEDLETLCGKDQLNLPFKQKLKMKTAVKTLQALYKLREKSFIAITMNEQNNLDKVKTELKNSQNVQTLLENHFIEIDDHSQKLKLKVDKEFDHILNTIKQRKQSLYKKIEEWKLSKLETVNTNISGITQYQTDLSVTKKKCKEMLKIDHNDRNRDYKIRQITEKLFQKHLKYNNFFKFIELNTQLMNIAFASDKTTVNELNEYGQITINGSKSTCSIPEITLKQVMKTKELNNGYKIKLKWAIFGKKCKNDFQIKYMEYSTKSNGFDDEKKNNIGAFDEWNVMHCKQIKTFDENVYEVEGEMVLKFNKIYMYKVLLLIEYPLSVLIESNILQLCVKYEIPIEGSVVHIPLTCYSHRKHDKDNDPSNMLISNDNKRYYSAVNNDFHSGDTEDWIVFKINDNGLYVPTKFVLKNWEYTNGVEKMVIEIGDGHNKWVGFNSSKVFHVKKGSAYHNKLQEFSISGVGSSLIRSDKFKHIKIRFIKNHGNHFAKNHRFIVYEFQLHGVMLERSEGNTMNVTSVSY